MCDKCIYCSPNHPPESPFTREHVIPEAFGRFKNNLVLNEGVCSDCNQFFANNLELVFARGSAEGILRLDHRIKPPEDVRRLHSDRVSFAMRTADELDGLSLKYGYEHEELVMQPVPQVGFPRRDGNGRVFVTERDLAETPKPLPTEADTTGPNLLVFNTEPVKERLIQILRARNISGPIGDEGLLPKQYGDEVWVEVKAVIDGIILRCAAKIAFNYLTKTAGISFVLTRDFDPIRCYIRYGVDPGYHIVRIDQHPILADDTVNRRHTNGHLITTGWSPDRRHIVGQVSLFNWATYRVSLARGFSGLWRELRSGHHFNIESLDVEPLLGIPRPLL